MVKQLFTILHKTASLFILSLLLNIFFIHVTATNYPPRKPNSISSSSTSTILSQVQLNTPLPDFQQTTSTTDPSSPFDPTAECTGGDYNSCYKAYQVVCDRHGELDYCRCTENVQRSCEGACGGGVKEGEWIDCLPLGLPPRPVNGNNGGSMKRAVIRRMT